MPQTTLALVPHPDDAEFYAGGTLARWAAEGAAVHLIVATDGRRGSYMEESAALAELRADEMRRAAAALGARPPVLLGHPDTELDRLPPGVLREQFVRAIRRVRPDTVVTEDPYALYEPHPDHRAVAWAAYEAVNCCMLPLVFPEHLAEGLEPHYVTEKYFYGDTLAGANRVIDITASIERKLAALNEHRTQVVFLVEGRMRQAALAGLDLGATLGRIGNSPATLLDWAIRGRDAVVGKRAGYQYGEAFRYERFDDIIEEMLAAAAHREA
jgi:LmbE family N-acetylglucosaminyl deacetylase